MTLPCTLWIGPKHVDSGYITGTSVTLNVTSAERVARMLGSTLDRPALTVLGVRKACRIVAFLADNVITIRFDRTEYDELCTIYAPRPIANKKELAVANEVVERLQVTSRHSESYRHALLTFIHQYNISHPSTTKNDLT